MENIIHKIEDAIGKVVRCNDGARRRIVSIDSSDVIYEVECGPNFWRELSPTARKYIENDFIGAKIVDA